MPDTTAPGFSDEVIGHVRRLWGEQLRPVDPRQIHPGLSAATRRFFIDVGLPDFEATWGLQCLRDRTDQVLTRDGRDYVVIGDIPGTTLLDVIDTSNDHVLGVDPLDRADEPVLMNTTVALWVLCAGVIEREVIPQIGVVEPGSAAAEDLVEGIRRFFTEVDPVAMRDRRDQNWHGYLREIDG